MAPDPPGGSGGGGRVLPDGVQQARGDALPAGQAEDPDAADPAHGVLRAVGAAPGPVVLHEVLPGHVFRGLGHRQHAVRLDGGQGNACLLGLQLTIHSPIKL